MSKKFSLSNKVAIITGGGSGIGKAIAITFAKQGANVNILDSNFDAANSTVNEILKINCIANAFQCDVSNLEEVLKTVKSINQIDILVNNAGIAHVGNIEECNEKDLDKLYNINIKGLYNCSKTCISLMKKNKNGGVILNLASIAASIGIKDRFAYSMTKGAVLSMTYSIAKDYIDLILDVIQLPAGTPMLMGLLKNYRNEKMLIIYQKLNQLEEWENLRKLLILRCTYAQMKQAL